MGNLPIGEIVFWGGLVMGLLQLVSLSFHHVQNKKLNDLADTLDTVLKDASVVGVQPPKQG